MDKGNIQLDDPRARSAYNPIMIPDSWREDPNLVEQEPPDLTRDPDLADLPSSQPAVIVELTKDIGPINHEANTLIAYYVSSYHTLDQSSPQKFDASQNPIPRYKATGQNIYLNFESAKTYATKLFRSTIGRVRAGKLKPVMQGFIPQTGDPALVEHPAWVMAAPIMGESSESSESSAKPPPRSFHAQYPGQKPRLSLENQTVSGAPSKGPQEIVKGMVGVVVLPMGMSVKENVASLVREDTRLCMGMLDRDVVEDIMVEFRGAAHW